MALGGALEIRQAQPGAAVPHDSHGSGNSSYPYFFGFGFWLKAK